MRTFHFHCERETDTGTTISVESTQEAATLEDAWCKVAAALGGRMAYLTDRAEDWSIWLDTPGGTERQYIAACPDCGGCGLECDTCREDGWVPLLAVVSPAEAVHMARYHGQAAYDALCDDERESERKRRANFAALADGFAPPYPSEY